MKLKVIVVTTLLVVLTGCTSDLTEARARYQCKDLGGVYLITSISKTVICNDGSRVDETKEPLPEGWRVGDTK